jgi:hypothetical protein
MTKHAISSNHPDPAIRFAANQLLAAAGYVILPSSETGVPSPWESKNVRVILNVDKEHAANSETHPIPDEINLTPSSARIAMKLQDPGATFAAIKKAAGGHYGRSA